MSDAASSSIDASTANDECVGPSSERAGTASGCDGCPNQKACAAGEGRKEDPDLQLLGDYDISCLRALFVAGERCDPTTSEAFSQALGVDVLDNYWQTETGWPICGFQVTRL